MPRLTIAIPTVNRADLLARAIDSALAQTSPEIEILVSDNGSTDTTPSVIARYSDPRLRTFRHDATMSAGRHGQFLIAQAQGEFFLGLSDDDFLEPDFAAEVLAAFDRHPESVFVYTGCAVHYEDIQVPAVVGPPFESGAELLANHYSGKREICWCACVTRVRLLRELGPQPDDFVIGDMFYWTRMALRGPVGCVPRVLSHYILLRAQSRNDNISHGTPPIVWARESQLLAAGAIEGLRQAGADSRFLSNLQAQSRSHIARSTANQLVWTRIRGASLSEALRWSVECLPYLTFAWPAVSRMGAALLVPPAMLRSALLKSAARLAAARTAAGSSPSH
jgi:glycosyl transferase family 2